MISDSVGDLLARIKNAYMVDSRLVSVPYSRIKEDLAMILAKEGFVKKIKVEPLARNKKLKTIKITLRYRDDISDLPSRSKSKDGHMGASSASKLKNKQPVLTDIKRISKPGVRIYVKREKIPRVLGGLGVVILSTSEGLMTGEEARKRGLGGEMICKVW